MSWRPQHGPPLTGAGDPPGQQPRPAPEHGAPTWQPAHVGYAAPGSQWAPPPAPPPAPWAGSANPWSPPGAAPQAPPFYAPHGPQPHTSHAGHYVPPGAPHRGAAWADPPQPPWPAQGFLGRVPAGRSDTSPSFASYSATNERYRYGSEPGLGYGSAPAVAGFGPPPASLKGPQPEVSDRGPSPMPWKDWYRNYAPYGMPPGPPNNDPNARIDPQPDRTPSGPRLQSRESLASAGALLDLRTQATYAAGESYASARPANPEHAQRAPSPAAPSPPSPASSVSYREDNLNSQQDSERLSSTRTSKGNRQRLDIKTKEPDGEFYTYRPPAQNSARSRKRRDSGDFDYRPVRKSRKVCFSFCLKCRV